MSYLLTSGGNMFKNGSNYLRVKNNYSYVQTVVAPSYSLRDLIFDPVIDNNRFFVCTTSDTVVAFDATSFAVLATISGFNSPKYLKFDPANNDRLLVFNTGNNTMSVINASSYTLISSTGSIFGNSVGFGFDPITANNRFYIVNTSTATLDIYNSTTFGYLSSVSIGTGSFSMEVDTLNENRVLICQNGNGVTAVDPVTLGVSSATLRYSGAILRVDPFTPNHRFLVTDTGAVYHSDSIVIEYILLFNTTVTVYAVVADPIVANNRWLIPSAAGILVVSQSLS